MANSARKSWKGKDMANKDARLGNDPLQWLKKSPADPDAAAPREPASQGLLRLVETGAAAGLTRPDLAALFAASLQPVLVCGPAGEIVMANEAFAALVGHAPEEILGRVWPLDFLGRRDIDPDESDLVPDGQPRRVIRRVTARDGRPLLLEVCEHGLAPVAGARAGDVLVLPRDIGRGEAAAQGTDYLAREGAARDERLVSFQNALYETVKLLIELTLNLNYKKHKDEIRDLKTRISCLSLLFQKSLEQSPPPASPDAAVYLGLVLQELFLLNECDDDGFEPRIDADDAALTGEEAFFVGLVAMEIALAAVVLVSRKERPRWLQIRLQAGPESAVLSLTAETDLPGRRLVREWDKGPLGLLLARSALLGRGATIRFDASERRLDILLPRRQG